jgi:hypothetical protein
VCGTVNTPAKWSLKESVFTLSFFRKFLFLIKNIKPFGVPILLSLENGKDPALFHPNCR